MDHVLWPYCGGDGSLVNGFYQEDIREIKKRKGQHRLSFSLSCIKSKVVVRYSGISEVFCAGCFGVFFPQLIGLYFVQFLVFFCGLCTFVFAAAQPFRFFLFFFLANRKVCLLLAFTLNFVVLIGFQMAMIALFI